ncbi:SDR family NAD(P)-dependent oxidoreductase [Rhodanobacter geophilus]|uniref:NADP-dependent 3-hydroxy acid dehydrogenase YdfG n=1 Tax=Rhodanobacter geophilus TaxID=3162488 RepID=A0ABV3QLP1_9GAMM
MAHDAIEGSVLITGASSGIGATYAQRFAARGHDLVLVARDMQRMEATAARLAGTYGVLVDILPADLTDREQLARVEQRLRTDSRIGALVNNAGMGAPERFVGAPAEALDKVVQLNVTAVMRLAAAALPAFKSRGRGTIINIASVLALAPELFSGVYSGTKAFVLNFSQSLQKELAGSGVHVQVVLPGATLTEIWARAGKNVEELPAHIVMPVGAMVDAALVGLDRGELVTVPPLHDEGQWQALQAARTAMLPHLSTDRPAARYLAGV